MSTSPDYGEPWQSATLGKGSITSKAGTPIIESFKLVKRAISCVNACQGMADPAAEIQAMREAIKEARSALERAAIVHRAITTYSTSQNDIDNKAANREHCEMLNAALAKLQPFLK